MFLIYWNQKEKLEDLDDLIFISRCTLIKNIKYIFFLYQSLYDEGSSEFITLIFTVFDLFGFP